MPIAYLAVFQSAGAVNLAEYAAFQGNFAAVAKEYLASPSASRAEGKYAYSTDGHNLCFLKVNGFVFNVVTDDQFGKSIPSALLEKMADAFAAGHYAEKAAAAGGKEGALNATYGKELKALLLHATQHPEELSKLASVKAKIEEVKAITLENVAKVIDRGEHMERIVEKSEGLVDEADRFSRKSHELRRKVQWQNIKMKLVIALAVVLLAVVIFLLVCFSGGNCLK